MTDQETLYMMALTQVPSLSLTNLHLLIDELGSASAIYENRKDLKQVLPSASPKFLDGMGDFCNYLKRAEEELEFCRKGKIRCLGLNDEDYPQRLKDCNDAPVLLYFRGSANLNSQHIVSMVGTRQITNYGKDLCRSFVRDLKQVCPDALVVSGLAYGVDVNCHRAALEQGLETVGVLAHGLDQIYPRHHRETAKQMVDQGGLLTEDMSNTVTSCKGIASWQVCRMRSSWWKAQQKAVPSSPQRLHKVTIGRCGLSLVASSTPTRRDATCSSSRTKLRC